MEVLHAKLTSFEAVLVGVAILERCILATIKKYSIKLGLLICSELTILP